MLIFFPRFAGIFFGFFWVRKLLIINDLRIAQPGA